MTGPGKLILFIGGARSGKSRLAEERALAAGGAVAYIATAPVYDDEMAHRVKLHRKRRPGHWATIEETLDLAGALDRVPENTAVVLLDCLTLWLTNRLLEKYRDDLTQEAYDDMEKDMRADLARFCQRAKEQPFLTLVVANEVGCGIVPESPMGRIFRDMAGRANQLAAGEAHEVYYVVAGYPLAVKGGG